MSIYKFTDSPDLSGFVISEEDAAEIPIVMARVESFLHREITNESFQELCDQCFWLIKRIPLPMHWVDSNFIVRSRENIDGDIFSEEWQISYHSRDFLNIHTGRFNRPEEPMFYGALKGNDHKGDNVPTATLECCKRILEPNEISPFYDFTLGKWMIKENFHVINLLYHEDTMNNNTHIRKYLEDYFGAWQNRFSLNIGNNVRHYMNFFSALASAQKPTLNHYFICNAFWASVREYYKWLDNTNVLGIVYPSWVTEFNGINIVMTPEAVDAHLKLEGVGMYRYNRDKHNPKEFWCGPLTELVPLENGCFTIPPFDLSLFS